MSDDERPIIGVTGPDRGGGAAWLFTRFAVWLAGGHAVRITPQHPRTLDGLDGLIVGGGADVDPELYGGEKVPLPAEEDLPADAGSGHVRFLARAAYWILNAVLFPLTWAARKLVGRFDAPRPGGDVARDALETRLINDALVRHLPVLGICRGAQLLNVCLGGSLHQHLTGFYVEDPETRTILPRKRVVVEPGARLAGILGRHPSRVNALHRQAIDRLGRGLRVAARDRNGIVQAIEHASLPMLLGVQWHPEYLPQRPEQRRLFRALVREARRIAATRRVRESLNIPNLIEARAPSATSAEPPSSQAMAR